MQQDALEIYLSDLQLGEIRYFDTIDSTNDFAASWASEGAPDRSLVIADEQTAGRGRGDHKWFTPPGAALAFSLILGPESFDVGEQVTRMTGLGSLGVCRVLRGKYQLPAQIKWPNDVLLAGRKAAGVLAEASWVGDRLSTVVLGVGINVGAAAIPPQGWNGHHARPFPATSVESALGGCVNRLVFLRHILIEILEWLPDLQSQEFIRSWCGNLAFRGEWVKVVPLAIEGGRMLPFDGLVVGLCADGSLKVRRRSGDEVSLRVGEIRLCPVDSSPK